MNREERENVEQIMAPYLNETQRQKLRDALMSCEMESAKPEEDKVTLFVAAKRVEGCSDKTLRYYETVLHKLTRAMNKAPETLRTEDLRLYLDAYQRDNKVSRSTVDNVRRIFSSFFSWLEEEDYIVKSPARRIHKVKTMKTVKETYSDETLERLRDGSRSPRDLALLDMLISTGMRVGELVKLNRRDIDFESRECVVLGKGKKRRVYFDARTKLHLQAYLASRQDENEALFVSLESPHRRLQISGVEIRLKTLGKALCLGRVHPHKFRRTLATMAIDKGMPIEQVQQLLGHKSIDTTLQYAMVNENNVKIAHRKYIG